MLALKPNCECCDKDLPPDSNEAMICSFECTFCKECISEMFDNACPNCSGNVSVRPTRIGEMLVRNPASTKRVLSRYEINIVDGEKTITRTKVEDS